MVLSRPMELQKRGSDRLISKSPMSGEFADRLGAFTLVPLVTRGEIDPGDVVEIEAFITGYGRIDAAKVTCYPSPQSVDVSQSTLDFGLKKHGDKFVWGQGPERLPQTVSQLCFVVEFRKKVGLIRRSSLTQPRRDRHEESPRNRKPMVKSPLRFILRTPKTVSAGVHSLEIVLTYFNGETSCARAATAQFSVRSFFQRHEAAVWGIGLTATLFTIAGVVLQFRDLIIDLGWWR